VAAEIHDLSRADLIRLLAGDPRLHARLAAGECLRAETPFLYPGRRGPVVVQLTPGPGPGPDVAPGASAVRAVRISDGGGLIKSLDEQGMDLSIDMILSKTVFHVVKEHEGGTIAGGEICLDSTSDAVSVDLWRFLQLAGEILGLRHSKYKDALLHLSRRQDAPDLIGWGGR
jgi:hypothetical protein